MESVGGHGLRPNIFYHGTSVETAWSIQANGFDAARSGKNAGALLGPGVYCTATLDKAMDYAKCVRTVRGLDVTPCVRTARGVEVTRVAGCGNVLQSDVVFCSVLQCVALCDGLL